MRQWGFRAGLACTVAVIWGGGANAAADTLTVGPSGTYSTIGLAVVAADPGDIIEVEDGTYNEVVTINKALTIRATGTGAVVHPNSGKNKGVFMITAGNGVTIEGFQIVVDMPYAFTGVHVYEFRPTVDNVTVRNCTFTVTQTGAAEAPPSNTLPFGSAAGSNAGIVIVNRQESTGAMTVTIQGNTVGSAAAPFRTMGILTDYCKGFIGGPNPGDGNTVYGEDMDISVRFAYDGDMVVEGNMFRGWGDEMNRAAQMDIGNPKVNGRVYVRNNTFIPQTGTSPNGKVHRRNLQVKNYSSENSDVFITSNTFHVLAKGVLLSNAQRANITGNTFMAIADSALLIEVNNKNYSSSHAVQALVGGLPTNSVTIQGNTFDGNGFADVTALEFRDHTQRTSVVADGPVYLTTATLGGPGALANVFEEDVATFINLDASSGETDAGVGLTLYPPGASGGFNSTTTMHPFSTDLLASENLFDVGTGPRRPAEMSSTERAALDAKITDALDNPSLARVALEPDPVVIAAVSTRGGDGDDAKDYILLANQTGAPIDLTGYELRARAGLDEEESTLSLSGTIPARGHFLIASAAYGSAVEGVGVPHQSAPGLLLGGIDHETSFSVSLFDGTGPSAREVDGFSFGKGAQGPVSPDLLGEGAPFVPTLSDPAAQVFVRKRVGGEDSAYVDTNSNYNDLEVADVKAPAVGTFTPVALSGFHME